MYEIQLIPLLHIIYHGAVFTFPISQSFLQTWGCVLLARQLKNPNYHSFPPNFIYLKLYKNHTQFNSNTKIYFDTHFDNPNIFLMKLNCQTIKNILKSLKNPTKPL